MTKQENALPVATAKNEKSRRGAKATWRAPHSRSIQMSRSLGKPTVNTQEGANDGTYAPS